MTISITYDPDLDWQTFLGVERVTLARKGLDGSGIVLYSAVDAVLRNPSAAPTPAGPAQAVQTQARIHLRASTLAVTPRKGDQVYRANGDLYEVTKVTAAALSTRFACECLRTATGATPPAVGGSPVFFPADYVGTYYPPAYI